MNYEFINEGLSVTVNAGGVKDTIPKNQCRIKTAENVNENKILYINAASTGENLYTIDLSTDTITGLGSGSTTADELKAALLPIFFLDESGGVINGDVYFNDLFDVEEDGNGNILKTISLYDMQFPSDSVFLGRDDAVKIGDTGQQPAYTNKYNNSQYLMIGQKIDSSGIVVPTVKISSGSSSFDLQPIDTDTEVFSTPVEFSITSQQNVVGLIYRLKISATSDVVFKVVRESENGGEDTVLVNEVIPQANLSLNGVSFDLNPKVDFETNKVYRLIFEAQSGDITIKGVQAGSTNENGVSRALNTSFIPYIRRDEGYVYEVKNLAVEGEGGGSVVVKGATPPSDTSKLWYNTNDSIIYFNEGGDWLSEQLFGVVFNEQGTTPNNTFFRVGNTVGNDLGNGYHIGFDAKIENISFNRAPNTAQAGNFWLYSNEQTGTNNAAVICSFAVGTEGRGVLTPNVPTTISDGKYISMRWSGNQTNNNIVELRFRKKHS